MSISTTSDSNLDPKTRPSTATEEEMQLQVVLALSRDECEKAEEMRKSDDARLQLALEESQKQVVRRATSTSTQPPAPTSNPFAAWKKPVASVPSVSLISSNSINLFQGYDERSNEIERLAFSLSNNCAVTPSTNKIPMMSSRTIVVAKYNYEPRLDDELRLIKGENVCVVEMNVDGWWKGEAPNGSVGWFPSNYVEMLNNLAPPKTISDMPVDVVGMIIERSDYKEQLILRKTSKSLRELVDQHKPACTRLNVDSSDGCTFCQYDDYSVAYVVPKLNDRALLEEYYTLNTIISTVNYQQMAFDDFALTLKNRKVRFEDFSFSGYCQRSHNDFDDDDDEDRDGHCEYESMQNILESNNHQLSVKACSIDSSSLSHVMSILPHLKPGVLEKITLDDDSGLCLLFEKAIEQIALLEQWKQAKELELICGLRDGFLVKHFTHFKRFQFHECPVWSDDSLDHTIKFIMGHENFEFCSFSAESDPAVLLNRFVGTPVSPNLYRYTVPDSDCYLELKIEDQLIAIEKKKK